MLCFMENFRNLATSSEEGHNIARPICVLITIICFFSSSLTHNKLYFIRFILATSLSSGTDPASRH
jgi:hypothetical protein